MSAIRLARLALRNLLRQRSPLAAAGVLALAIGMSVAMFSLVDAVLLRPLPFPSQDALQVIWKADPLAGPQLGELAYPELGDLQENIRDFEAVAVMPTSLYGYAKTLEQAAREPVQIESTPVSHDFFRVLRVAPVLGRDFRATDEGPGAAPVVILSERVWREQFQSDPSVLGRILRLNGVGTTVIGVMARGVEFPRGAGLWTPLGVDARITEQRGNTFLQAIARLKPGADRASAARQVDALFQRLAREHPEFYAASQRAVVTPLTEYWTGSARLHLWILLAASLLLLVAAAISSGNVLLSRMLARRAEIATRMALGAGAAQLLAQLAAEGVVTAGAAVLGGMAIAQGAIRMLVRWSPGDIPRLEEASVDWRALVFAAALALLASVVCSVLPGWAVVRTSLESALREGSTRTSESRAGGRARDAFLAAQAALTVVLLVLAGLLFGSYRAMIFADTGFAHRDAMTMNLQLRGAGPTGPSYTLAERRDFYARLLRALRESPGVSSAGAVLLRPLEGTIGWDVSYEFEFEDNLPPDRVRPKANYEVITPGYLETAGTAIVEGRYFSEHDTEASERVVILNRSLADRIRAAGREPVGSRVKLGLGGWAKVIGVARDARYRNVTQKGADLYVSYLQAQQPTNYVAIRGTLRPQELSALVRRTLAGMDRSQAVAGEATIGELADRNAARHRFNMLLLACFGVTAVLLAAAGIASIVAERAEARRQELAIKTALGATRGRLIREVASRSVLFVLLGEVLGAGCAVGLGSLAAGLLYDVSPKDPKLLLPAAGLLLGIALLAAIAPALGVGQVKDLRRS